MPCSACGHGSTTSKPSVLILGHKHKKIDKEKSLNQRIKEKKEKNLKHRVKIYKEKSLKHRLRIYKEKIRNLEQKTKIKKSIAKQKPPSKFNMFKKMNYY